MDVNTDVIRLIHSVEPQWNKHAIRWKEKRVSQVQWFWVSKVQKIDVGELLIIVEILESQFLPPTRHLVISLHPSELYNIEQRSKRELILHRNDKETTTNSSPHWIGSRVSASPRTIGFLLCPVVTIDNQ